MTNTPRSAAQRRAAVITSYRRVAAKARRAGQHSNAENYDRIADSLQRAHERASEFERERRERALR